MIHGHQRSVAPKTKIQMTSLLTILSFLCATIHSSSAFVTTTNGRFTLLTQRSLSDNVNDFSNSEEEKGQASSSSSSEWSDADLYASLRNRISQVEEQSTKMPLVVLDSMLPRQVLTLQISNPLMMRLVRTRIAAENPHFGVVGTARLSTGRQIHLQHGVEVRIDNPIVSDDGIKLDLVAGRRFLVDDSTVEPVDGGWTAADVTFLNSAEEEEREIRSSETTHDRMAVARAISKAEQFDSPSANMKDNLSLVDRWVELARHNERRPGQIDELLECIGDIPPSSEPTERALWIGALINPLPALGVAVEIRPSLLTATTAEKRVDVALDGILRSIRHMDGSARMF